MLAGSAIVIFNGIFDVVQVARRKKTFLAQSSQRVVKEVAFNQFKGEIETRLTDIDKRLNNIDNTLERLVGSISHAETPSNTETKATKTKPKGKRKSGKT